MPILVQIHSGRKIEKSGLNVEEVILCYLKLSCALDVLAVLRA